MFQHEHEPLRSTCPSLPLPPDEQVPSLLLCTEASFRLPQTERELLHLHDHTHPIHIVAHRDVEVHGLPAHGTKLAQPDDAHPSATKVFRVAPLSA